MNQYSELMVAANAVVLAIAIFLVKTMFNKIDMHMENDDIHQTTRERASIAETIEVKFMNEKLLNERREHDGIQRLAAIKASMDARQQEIGEKIDLILRAVVRDKG